MTTYENTMAASAARIARSATARTGCTLDEAAAEVARALGFSKAKVLHALELYPVRP
jgi:hypothetical protein